jgi:hypothetical protein
MSRNGFRNIRAAVKSQRQFHAQWEKKQQAKLKAKYGIAKENQTDSRRIGKDGRTD